MKKMYGKKIETKEQITLYNKIKELTEKKDNLELEIRHHYDIARKIEGKHATGIITEHCVENGLRGYDYSYANVKDKEQENKEIEEYIKTEVEPRNNQLKEINTQLNILNEKMCILLWNCSSKEYYAMCRLNNAKKELEKQIATVKELEKQLEEIRKGVDK